MIVCWVGEEENLDERLENHELRRLGDVPVAPGLALSPDSDRFKEGRGVGMGLEAVFALSLPPPLD